MRKNLTVFKMTILTLLAVVMLTACGQSNEAVIAQPEEKLAEFEDNITQHQDEATHAASIKQLVYDYSVRNIKPQSASITSRELIVTDEATKLTYDLPEDEFFVSIAPYIHETHPCKNHSLTGCQGEMIEKEFNVYIEDVEGNKILDETLTSHANGFIDLWLPRDKTYRISIVHDGKEAESTFSTFETDGTCITNIQLL